MPLKLFLSLLLTISLFIACNSDYVPRPRGYFQIPLPEHRYQVFDRPGYPYTFEYPVYANILQDSTFFEERPENPYWINIDFPQFNGRIYISYKKIGDQTFDKLRDDSYKMTYKHTLKATSIEDSVIQTSKGITGVFFNVGGNAATGKQFYLTDTLRHFLRGALYFDATPNEDSLSTVNTFLEQDMRHLINSFRWKNN
jgi:gliding motility-associated lipoprotein GldD